MNTVTTAPNAATVTLLQELQEFVSGQPTLDSDDLSDLMTEKADFPNVEDGSTTYGTTEIVLKTSLGRDLRGDLTRVIHATVSLNRRGTTETVAAKAFESYA